MDKPMWRDLLEMWLKSIGCKNMEYPYFDYQGWQYQYYINYDTIDVGRGTGEDGTPTVGDIWANVDLDTCGVDPRDPSFKPNKFFRPLKKWMNRRRLLLGWFR